jgi:nitric oxide dioxygenase
VVRVSAPAGDFFLDNQDSRPLVLLLSGGVGLTPILSMLDTLVAGGGQRDIWYVHAALSGRHHAMKQHLKEVVAAHPRGPFGIQVSEDRGSRSLPQSPAGGP